MARKRRNPIEVIEDSFLALPVEEQGKLVAVLQALHRMQVRQCSLADLHRQGDLVLTVTSERVRTPTATATILDRPAEVSLAAAKLCGGDK